MSPYRSSPRERVLVLTPVPTAARVTWRDHDGSVRISMMGMSALVYVRAHIYRAWDTLPADRWPSVCVQFYEGMRAFHDGDKPISTETWSEPSKGA